LILARKHARARTLSPSTRARVHDALAQDPAAWSEAASRAKAWRAVAALRALRERLNDGGVSSRPTRALVLTERAARIAADPRAGAGVIRRRLRQRSAAVVALSGLDGAGKSTQAKALGETLTQLGISNAIVWPPAKNMLFRLNPRIKRPLRALLNVIGRPGGQRPPDPLDVEYPPMRMQSAPVAHALAAVVALSQALALRGAAEGDTRRSAQVLIYDRYVLDSIVYLRERWGHGRALRWQATLIRLLARRPAASFLLELDPDAAFTRKRDYPLQTVRERAVLYRQLHNQLGVKRLDATRPIGNLSEEIARDVWLALPGLA
jgi:thymidylate kinase